MATGDVIKYKITTEDGQRHEVATLEQIRAVYPTAYVTHVVVEDEGGGVVVQAYDGPQVVDEVREQTAKEMRAELERRGVEVPRGAKRDDLIELLARPDPQFTPPENPAVVDAGDAPAVVIETDGGAER